MLHKGVDAVVEARRIVQAQAVRRTALGGALRMGGIAGRQLVTKNPLGVALTLAYIGYIHQDEIKAVAEHLATAVEDAIPDYSMGGPGMMGMVPPVIGLPGVPKPKRKNRFSKAVGKAIKAIKGKVKDPKRAFSLATKQASRVSKGKKKPKGSGAAVKAWVAAKKVYPDYILRQAMKK